MSVFRSMVRAGGALACAVGMLACGHDGPVGASVTPAGLRWPDAKAAGETADGHSPLDASEAESFQDTAGKGAETGAAKDTGAAKPETAVQDASTQNDSKSKDLQVVPDGGPGPELGASDAAPGPSQDAAADLPWWQNPPEDAGPGADVALASEIAGSADAGGSSDAGTVGSSDAGTGGVPGAPLCSPLLASIPVELAASSGGKVDLIIFVDTSPSMVQEAAWINQNLNKLANFLVSQKIDLHVVLIGTGLGLCIAPPLAGTSCGPGPTFMPVKVKVNSTDGLAKVISTYPQWQNFLRKDAVQNFLAVTDDESSMPAATFKAALAKLTNPGFSNGFVMHSIVAYGPLPKKGCATGAKIGQVFLDLTKETGGTQFQVCLADWNPIFDELGKGVAATAKALCSYAIPVPAGKQLKAAELTVNHVENQVFAPLQKVSGPAACAANPNGWFYDDPNAPSAITVCAAQCSAMKGGKILFNFGCM